MRIHYLALCGVLTLLPFRHCEALVIAIDSTTTNPALTTVNTPETEIVGFTAGSATYGVLRFLTATAISNGSQTFAAVSSADPPDDVPTALGLVGNAFITQGKANASFVDYAIGKTVDAADTDRFFMYELVLDAQAADDVVVLPLASGTPIGSWSLSLAPGDYGPQTDPFRMTLLGGSDVGARGVTFTLADFSGDTGTLGGVDGLRFSDSGAAWDPLSVGIVVPEPSGLGLCVLAAASISMLRRRRKRKQAGGC